MGHSNNALSLFLEEEIMKELENKKYWIWFSLIKGLGSRKKLELLKIYKNPENIYNLKKEELLKIKGLGEKITNNIIISKNENIINTHIKFMKRNNIKIIHIFERDYPQILKQIYDPPICLYIKGKPSITSWLI